ncbi:MAG: ABC transporter permease [Actinomycetota bacterium]|nr:ABC transporter permease [Actinomycetota bacterium]
MRAWAHAGWEARLLLRNGEQLLLTFIIPVGLLLGLALTGLLPDAYGDERLARSVATVLTVSVLSSAFTSLAIATGFERRSGALRFLSTTPLGRVDLLAGKALATAAVTCLSTLAVLVTAAAIGWRPPAGAAWAVVPLLVGIASLAACGFALAGLMRAEAVLAVANGAFLVLLMFGGVIVPADSLPDPLGAIAPWLPSGALAASFTETLVDGAVPSAGPLLVLLAWLSGAALLAARTFRWS